MSYYEEYRPAGFNYLPPVIKNLLIINILVFLGQQVLEGRFGINLDEQFALFHYSSPFFHLYQYITYMFLHGGFSHIFFNMFALWMFGNVLENIWGSKRFLVYYFVTGLGAAIIHTIYFSYKIYSIEDAAAVYALSPGIEEFEIFIREQVPAYYKSIFTELLDHWYAQPGNPGFIDESKYIINLFIEKERNIPTVGASGAVFGLLLAFGMLLPNTVIYLYFAIPIKAKYFVIIYGAVELFLGVSSGGDNIAHFAHLGGMLFGFLFIKYWSK
ncbi:MAG: rhomboid family intramembrane serine protease [Bacteroidetes bacterium]|nr:rhomboid family intramembrane serine protease [Bacteroidota bacterium]